MKTQAAETFHYFTQTGVLPIAQLDLPSSLSHHILSLDNSIKHTWNDAVYRRETIDFGKIFRDLEKGEIVERPIPSFIKELRQQVVEVFNGKIGITDPEAYDNCIITIYKPGDAISPHRDRDLKWANESPERLFYFGDAILGLILEPDSLQTLFFEHPTDGEKSRFYIKETVGTAYAMQGPLRYEWRHGLLPVQRGRISITFRNIVAKLDNT